MDINTVMQTVLTLMVGALCWLIKRSITKFDEGIAKLDQRISDVELESDRKLEKLREQFHDFQKDMPLVYTTREDFILTMNRVEDKLNRILYRNGGSSNE